MKKKKTNYFDSRLNLNCPGRNQNFSVKMPHISVFTISGLLNKISENTPGVFSGAAWVKYPVDRCYFENFMCWGVLLVYISLLGDTEF